mmetsp:Transcript_14627/g.33837  ORF Transcript_14627/g.33837 Transcript_14627/m.33837 type:complete len:576 (-) Transcript_14627:261-1988(-)
MFSEQKKRGPNPKTVADGYSLSDERQAVTGPELDFDYDDNVMNSRGGTERDGPSGLEHHLPNPDAPNLRQSHQGEHRGDFGGTEGVRITNATYFYVLCAALNSCNLGYDIGVSTNVGPLLQEHWNLSDIRVEIFIGSLNLFAMFGAIFSHYFSDRYGRRVAFIVAALSFILGVGILVMAINYTFLMIGRVFVGLGVGFGLAIDPLYISEVSPAAYRGQLVTWAEIALNVGIVLGFLSGIVFFDMPRDIAWRYMFAVGAVLPVLMILLASTAMVESPRWLVSQNNESMAKRVLKSIYGDGYDVKPVLRDIKEELEREELVYKTVGWDVILFPPPAFRRMLMVGIGTAVGQQAVGIEAIQYYLPRILERAGDERNWRQTWIVVILGLIKLVFIIVGGMLFDRRGRRPLFFVSLVGMSAALLMLSINFFSGSTNSSFSIFALGAYLALFSVGIGPGAWLIPSEVFATCIRAKAMSVATFLNRVTATLMSSTFLTSARAMTWPGFFLLLSAVCLIVLAFLYVYLPETKGRSLEDMTLYFAEITGDRSVLEAENRIAREREGRAQQAQAPPPTRPTTGLD